MQNNNLVRNHWEKPWPLTGAASSLADDTVAVVLAGGKGTRLEPLRREICKPALPFDASYRSIDFSLSNCVNSGIRRIRVATQHKPEALLHHLEGVWGDAVIGPQHYIAPWRAETRAAGIGYRGTADAVYRNLPLIEELECRLVLILTGDHDAVVIERSDASAFAGKEPRDGGAGKRPRSAAEPAERAV